MKIKKYFLISFILCLGSLSRGEWFLHQSLPTNMLSHISFLPEHLTSSSSERILIAPLTYEYCGDHADKNYGIYHSTFYNSWAVFYEDTAPPFREKNFFACYKTEPGDTAFTHVHVPAEQSLFKRSFIDHPSLNNNPSALVFLTHNWSVNLVYNDQYHFIGYNNSSNKWYIVGYILNDEFTDIPANAAWNVLVKSATTNAFIHTTSVLNVDGNQTTLDHPMLNDNPNALLLFTHVYAPSTGMEFSKTQARYLKTTGRWVIEALDGFDMNDNAQFHVFVSEAPNTVEPKLTINQITNTLVEVEFPTENGYTYQLQSAPELGLWQNEGLSFDGNGEVISYPTSTVLPNNNYQVIRSLKEF